MAEYLIQSENLTSIADEIRVLSGTEDAMSPSAMETKLQEANTDVNTETDLIEQIQLVLSNKTNVEDVTPEVNVYTEKLEDLNDAISALELELRKKTNVDVEIKILTAKLSSDGTSISFTGLTEEPKMFAICPTGNITFNTSNRFIVNVVYDGTTTQGMYAVGSGSWNATYTGTYSNTYFSWTYSNGTLTVKTSSSTNGGNFSSSVTYQLAYVTATEGSISNDTNEGLQLPTLTNAGVAADLALGKQLIDGNGNIIIGTHECETDSGDSVTAQTIVPNTTQYGSSAWTTVSASVNAQSANTTFTMTANPNSTASAYINIDVSAYSTMKIVGTFSNNASTSSQLQLNVGLFGSYSLATGYSNSTVYGGGSGTINQTYDISNLSGSYKLGVSTVQGNSSGIHQTTVTITSIELY
jgi:hypothetical protein